MPVSKPMPVPTRRRRGSALRGVLAALPLRLLVVSAAFGASGLGVGCASGPQFPSISAETEQAEIAYQRDATLAALRAGLGVEDNQRRQIEELRAELKSSVDTLHSERASKDALSQKLDSVGQEQSSFQERLQAAQSEHAKLREMHEKLNRMAQETLEEVTALRQKNETLQRERQQSAQGAANQERRVAKLSKEVDDLRAELLKVATTGAAPVDPTAANASATAASPTVATSAGDADPASATAEAPAGPPKELGVEDVLAASWGILKARYQKARQGTIAWDAVDITLVSVAGGLALAFLIGFVYVLRVRSLKRQLKQYRAYYVGQAGQAGQRTPAAPREGGDEAAAHAAARERAEATDEESAAASSRTIMAAARQTGPEDFSPIFRSSASSPERDDASGAGSGEDEDAVGNAQTMLSNLSTSGSKSSRSQAPEEPRPARRVIGAVREDSGTAVPEPAPRRPATAQGKRPATDPVGVRPAAAAPPRPGATPAAGSPSTATRKTPRPNPSPSLRLRREQSKTEMISRDELDALEPSPPPPKERGSHDEQELLAELKSIIDKKFEQR